MAALSCHAWPAAWRVVSVEALAIGRIGHM